MDDQISELSATKRRLEDKEREINERSRISQLSKLKEWQLSDFEPQSSILSDAVVK